MGKLNAVRDLAKITVAKGTVSGNVLSNDVNNDGGNVFLRFIDNDRIGAKAPAEITVVGKYGTFLFKADGSYTYNLDKSNPAVINAHGGNPLVEKVTYKISDGAGATDFDHLQINIYPDVNARPHAVHDNVDVYNGLGNGDLLINDTDSDGDTLQVSYIGKQGNLKYVNSDLGSVTFDATYGKVTIDRAGHVSYDVNEDNAAYQALTGDHVLKDTLIYKVFDGGLSNSSDQDTVTFVIHHADLV